jgi:molybdate transport system substrate-binding protein
VRRKTGTSPVVCGLLLLLSLCPGPALAAEALLIAVASNFQPALEVIAGQFTAQTGQRVELISGSTGKHYAQILQGAPFDLFFAADSERPRRLEQAGIALPGTRFRYAEGELVLWSPQADRVDPQGEILRDGSFRRLAIANPRLAPYGLAAQQTLQSLGLWDGLQDRLVRGENIAQAFHFVHSGNAELGLLARSQIVTTAVGGSYWMVPRDLHRAIEQHAVLLREGEAARAFLRYVRSPAALEIIHRFGYAAD